MSAIAGITGAGKKGEVKKIGDLSIKFIDFDISGMRSEKPKVGAKLLVNNKRISLYKVFSKDSQAKPEEIKIP